MLQHDRHLKAIAQSLEKKIKSELLKMQKDKREDYEKFWAAFGRQIKYGAYVEYGAHKELLQDQAAAGYGNAVRQGLRGAVYG